MWFKNLQVYRLTQAFSLNAEALHEQLLRATFRSCGSLEMASQGWVPPLGRHGTLLTHEATGRIMICMRREEKVLPAAVVQEVVSERVEEIESEQMRTVRRKERNEIREEVVEQLLPKAFTRSRLTYAYLDPELEWIVVDASSANKAEELVTLLRQTLGSFPVKPLAVVQEPAQIMTAWLQNNDQPSDLMVQDECELRDPERDGGVIRCRRQDLAGEEIRAHLTAGKRVVKLAVSWDDRLACVVTEELSIKRLRFLELVQEQAAEVDAQDQASRFDADFALMGLELARFLPRVLELFGGERVETASQLNVAAG